MADNINPATPPSSTPPVAPEPGVFDAVLDSMFGKDGDGDTKGGEPAGRGEETFTMPATTGNTEYDKLIQQSRSFQSEKDKLAAEMQKITEQVQTQYQPVVEFFNQIYEDEEVRRAFISELEPDLVKPKDPHTFIKERLAKEFGEGYDPEDESDKIKARMYNIRTEQLMKEAFENAGKNTPKTLKQLKEERKRLAEVKQQEVLAEKEAIRKQLAWDENRYNEWVNWAQKVKPIDIAKLYDRLSKQASKNTNFGIPNLSNVSGGSPVMPNQFKQELDKFFGPD